jgi:rsbT co-antagonist protein RsbR
MAQLELDESEIQHRRAFFGITDEDLARLAGLKGFAARHMDDIVKGFYELLLAHPETRSFIPDAETMAKMESLQRDYFLTLFEGRCDSDYVKRRLLVGAVHERIGMAPKWYIGAYRRYLELLLDRLFADLADPAEARLAFQSAQKLICFDMALAIDAYLAASHATLGRHQEEIRELSTPVIRVHDNVLLLPLVGAVDSLRAQQVMEAVLVRVIEDQARVVIIDIAGVPMVDASVADHLIRTTAAVRLVGAHTILTGISPEVARTIVRIGVDITTMHTLSRLADGIALALSMVGKAVTTLEPTRR